MLFVDERFITLRNALINPESDNPRVKFSRPNNDSSRMKGRPVPLEMSHNHRIVLSIDWHVSMTL